MARWCNDAGHGGSDPGAVANGVEEKVWCLEAQNYIHERLVELGIDSYVTRTGDYNISSNDRTDSVKDPQTDYCLSHHFNAGGGEGVETIHSIHANPSNATKIAHAIRDAGQPFRRVFSRESKRYPGRDYYFMHRNTGSVQTTIIEYGFLDHSRDFNRLKSKSYRKVLYEAVIKAVCDIEGVRYHPLKVAEKVKDTNSERFYRVITGSFKDKENADNRVKELKDRGFESFIEPFDV